MSSTVAIGRAGSGTYDGYVALARGTRPAAAFYALDGRAMEDATFGSSEVQAVAITNDAVAVSTRTDTALALGGDRFTVAGPTGSIIGLVDLVPGADHPNVVWADTAGNTLVFADVTVPVVMSTGDWMGGNVAVRSSGGAIVGHRTLGGLLMTEARGDTTTSTMRITDTITGRFDVAKLPSGQRYAIVGVGSEAAQVQYVVYDVRCTLGGCVQMSRSLTGIGAPSLGAAAIEGVAVAGNDLGDRSAGGAGCAVGRGPRAARHRRHGDLSGSRPRPRDGGSLTRHLRHRLGLLPRPERPHRRGVRHRGDRRHESRRQTCGSAAFAAASDRLLVVDRLDALDVVSRRRCSRCCA